MCQFVFYYILPSRHGPDFHRPQSQITIDSPDFHLRRSQNCLLGSLFSSAVILSICLVHSSRSLGPDFAEYSGSTKRKSNYQKSKSTKLVCLSVISDHLRIWQRAAVDRLLINFIHAFYFKIYITISRKLPGLSSQ